jgi:hypothetical protein
MSLQYMTLISNGDRGVGHTAGNWQDEMNDSPPLSAGAQSGTGTPNSQKDPKKPSVKMSIADYKNRKTTGFKPLPGPSAPTTEAQRGSDGNGSRSGHARNTSSASIGTPMARVPSVGDDNSQNEGGATGKTGQKVLVQEER